MMFHRVDSNSNPYDAYSNAGPSQAPAPRPAEPTPQQASAARFADTAKQQGEVPGVLLLPSGIQANRDAHVTTRVQETRNLFVASGMQMTKEAYVSSAVASSFAELPEQHQHEDALDYAIELAEQTWKEETALLAGSWNQSAAHRQTIDSATREWDREVDAYASTLAQQDAMEPVPGPSTQLLRQPGADSRAMALRSAYAAENPVLDEASRLASAGSAEFDTPGDRAAQQAPGIPPSREGSVDRLIETALTAAQTQKKSKQAPQIVNIVRSGVEELNAKAGREQIDSEHVLARYDEQSTKRKKLPSLVADSKKQRRTQLAIERRIGTSSADYVRHQKSAYAKALGVGDSPADYDRYRKAKRAKELGVGESSADYERHSKAELAKKLSVGTNGADYDNHRKAELAKELGVGESAADYDRYRKAKRAKELGVGESAADYDNHQKAERAKKLGAGESAADYLRYLKAEREKKAKQDADRET